MRDGTGIRCLERSDDFEARRNDVNVAVGGSEEEVCRAGAER